MAIKYKTYHIFTIGCQMNKADSERIEGYLESQGLKNQPGLKKADLAVFTTCGVRQRAEDRVYGLIPGLKRDNPRSFVILTGCLVYRADVRRRLNNYVDLWLPITELSNLGKLLKNVNARRGKNPARGDEPINQADGKLMKLKFAPSSKYLKASPKYNSGFSAYLPIGNGCDNFCSYCVVPYARGRESYRPAGEIIGEARKLIRRGYKEIILIAQNVNSYRDPKNNDLGFSELLKSVSEIPGDFWIRFATSHPKDMSLKLIKTLSACPKICRHIHLPAQSGNDEILNAMNRRYTARQYLSLVQKIRNKLNSRTSLAKKALLNYGSWIPPVSISTDIIVGFPGETRKQFNNTKKLLMSANFDQVFIARYSPRPGTAAAKLKNNVSGKEKKKREEELSNILSKTALQNNKKYLGKTVRILVETKTKNGAWYGKTETDKAVKASGNFPKNLTGKFINVNIAKAGDFGLEGTTIF